MAKTPTPITAATRLDDLSPAQLTTVYNAFAAKTVGKVTKPIHAITSIRAWGQAQGLMTDAMILVKAGLLDPAALGAAVEAAADLTPAAGPAPAAVSGDGSSGLSDDAGAAIAAAGTTLPADPAPATSGAPSAIETPSGAEGAPAAADDAAAWSTDPLSPWEVLAAQAKQITQLQGRLDDTSAELTLVRAAVAQLKQGQQNLSSLLADHQWKIAAQGEELKLTKAALATILEAAIKPVPAAAPAAAAATPKPAKAVAAAAQVAKPAPAPVAGPSKTHKALVPLLLRPEGCTGSEAAKALGWPSIQMGAMVGKLAQETGLKATRSEELREGHTRIVHRLVTA